MNSTPQPSQDVVVCLVTAPQLNAREIGRSLVQRQVVACVNIVSKVQSIYRWEGKVIEDEEALLVIKTTRAQVAPLEELLGTIHPYDTFELVALDVVAGAQGYLDWIGDSVVRA
jgi:periplasmic divalent cation tolerance protein